MLGYTLYSKCLSKHLYIELTIPFELNDMYTICHYIWEKVLNTFKSNIIAVVSTPVN